MQKLYQSSKNFTFLNLPDKIGVVLTRANSPSFSFLGSNEWANQTLKNAISDLKEGVKSPGSWLWNQRLGVVLIYQRELKEYGYFWQAERVQNWIHRLQPRRAELSSSAAPPRTVKERVS